MPSDIGAAWTFTVTGRLSGSATVCEPGREKVRDWLFFRRSVWGTGPSGPEVRVRVTSYVFFW